MAKVEHHAGEGKQAVKMTRLSCHRFRSNEVRLRLREIAYNLGNLCRRLVLPKRMGKWSLTSLQGRLVETGRPVVEACQIILAFVGGEPPDAPPLRVDGTADRVTALPSAIGRPPSRNALSNERATVGRVSERSFKRGIVASPSGLRGAEACGQWRQGATRNANPTDSFIRCLSDVCCTAAPESKMEILANGYKSRRITLLSQPEPVVFFDASAEQIRHNQLVVANDDAW
jgi:hypothetical protein